jgi:hypothetical protein
MWAVVWCSAVWASDSPYDELLADEGWRHLDTVHAGAAGDVQLDVKTMETPCLRAQATVDVPADLLLDVVSDVRGAKGITRERLIASEVLAQQGPEMEYFQHLDVPNWTLAADRYWVLRAERVESEHGPMFRWTRFDWQDEYPELAERLADEYPNAVEPSVNWGAWTFEEVEGHTEARYHLCSDAAGSLPAWVSRAAAIRTVPATVEDVVNAARKRLQALR